MVIAAIIIVAVLFMKYKPVYKVSIFGEEVGYILNKEDFETLLDQEIINPTYENIAYVDIEEMPKYSLIFADLEKTDETEIFNKVKEIAVTTYRIYSITVNGEEAITVNSREDAEIAVADLKKQYKNKLNNIDIVVNETYTRDEETAENKIEITNVETQVAMQVEKEITKQGATFDGVYFSVKPVSGIITSRYGSFEDIRSHAHSGTDIAAPEGTPIKAAAPGKVTFSGQLSGYGYLIIITHENGIQSYYGHCSKLYAKVGDIVEAGDVIAAVGSTGNSTGNHLHFEIRKNGKTINPQNYIYK